MASAIACRPAVSPPTAVVEPKASVQLPTMSSFDPEPFEVDLSPDPLPDGVAAAVDGELVLEEEVDRRVKELPAELDPAQARMEALAQLVDQRLLLAKADQMGLLVSDDEIDRALDTIAADQGIGREQLQTDVVGRGFQWDDYLEALISELIEAKVLDVYGVPGSATAARDDIEAWRARTMGCMRARAEIQVRDGGDALPENPFMAATKVVEFRFTGPTELEVAQLAAAAQAAAKTRYRLCDALISAELAIQELYYEQGYLEAQVYMPWPEQTESPVTVEVRTAAGRPHVFGTISFDQSAIPRPQRLEVAGLREQVAAIAVKGDRASMSALQSLDEQVARAFERGGVGRPIETMVERKERKTVVRVDLTYRLGLG